MKAFVESFSFSSGAVLIALVSSVIVWLLCSVFPASLHKLWVVIVPFALANCIYWSAAWFEAVGSDYNKALVWSDYRMWAPLFVVVTRVADEKPRKDGDWKLPDKWANFALVFDCETTIDIRQDLNFLWWRFCEHKDGLYVCQQEGVVFADTLDHESITLIREYASQKRADVEDGCPEGILVQSRTEFIDGEFWRAIQAGAVIVCFNAPFDLSRLALEYREARRKNTGGSMVLWKYRGEPDSFKPKLRIRPKDSRSAFINLAEGDPNNRAVYSGRFLDLSVLCRALRNRHLTLNGALHSFGLKKKKIEHEPTGRVTNEELAYGRRDVERTVALLNAMKREYDDFSLDLYPEQAFSAASITKAFLEEMRIENHPGSSTFQTRFWGSACRLITEDAAKSASGMRKCQSWSAIPP
jgi:hypothetical protein